MFVHFVIVNPLQNTITDVQLSSMVQPRRYLPSFSQEDEVTYVMLVIHDVDQAHSHNAMNKIYNKNIITCQHHKTVMRYMYVYAYLGGRWNPILGKREVAGVSDGSVRKSDGGFLQALHCDRCAICSHSAVICDRMSSTLKSRGVGQFGPKFPGVPLGVDP